MFDCRKLAQEIEDTEQKLRQLRLPQNDAEAEQLQELVFHTSILNDTLLWVITTHFAQPHRRKL